MYFSVRARTMIFSSSINEIENAIKSLKTTKVVDVTNYVLNI